MKFKSKAIKKLSASEAFQLEKERKLVRVQSRKQADSYVQIGTDIMSKFLYFKINV